MSTLFITVEGIGWDIGYSLTVSALLTHAYKTHSTTPISRSKGAAPKKSLLLGGLVINYYYPELQF